MLVYDCRVGLDLGFSGDLCGARETMMRYLNEMVEGGGCSICVYGVLGWVLFGFWDVNIGDALY